MPRWGLVVGVIGALVANGAEAQEGGGFTVVRGSDTVAVEEWSRDGVELRGSLVRRAGGAVRERVRYRATLMEDESAPLIELSAWRDQDPLDRPARQTVRVIFREDSVAVDEVTPGGGMMTRVLPTIRSAIAYLNLSVAMLEQATRRAAHGPADSLVVPFFNLGGGQTTTGTVRRVSHDSSSVRIGSLDFRLHVDADGRILGGQVPAERLTIRRTPPR